MIWCVGTILIRPAKITMTTNNRQDTLLIQFAKWPQPGKVKTRLAVELGDEGALQAHIRLTLAVLEQLLSTDLPVQFWWDRPLDAPPPAAASILKRLDDAGIAQHSQQGNDLGARMTHALTTGLQDFRQVIIVGSDCPSVDADYIHSARLQLQQEDVVLGPSDDGGYVLIGASRTKADMLDNIAWGTDQALVQTRKRLTETGLKHTVLKPRWDVDEPEDWRRFLSLSPRSH